jgi:hypothetical protein
MIFERFNVNGGWVVLLQTSRNLHGAVDSVVVPHKSAEESQDDYRRGRRMDWCGFRGG